MMIVEFTLAAEWELDDAITYYNAAKPGLGLEFLDEVESAVARIIEFPEAWQRLKGAVRRCQLHKFEYGLVYRVKGNVATIYAVMHLKRRPNYWRSRVKAAGSPRS